MADYVRTGKDPQGRRVGQRADGSVEVIQSSLLDRGIRAFAGMNASAVAAPTRPANPFMPQQAAYDLQKNIPTEALPMAGGLAGGIATGGSPVGAGLGAGAGRALQMARQDAGAPISSFQQFKDTTNNTLNDITRAGIAAGGMQAAGNAIAGGLTSGATKAFPQMAKNPFGRMAVSTASGAGTGAALDPQHPQRGALIGGGVGLAGSGLAELAGPALQATGRVFSSKKGKAFGTELQQSAFRFKQSQGEQLDQALTKIEAAHPEAPLSGIKDHVDTLQEEIKHNPSIRGLIEQGQRKADTTLLTDLLDGTVDPNTLTLRQGQQLKAAVDRVPSISSKLPKGKFADYSPHEIPLLDFKDGVRSAQLNVDPKVSEAFQGYHEGMSDYRMVRPALRPTSLKKGGVPKLNESPFTAEAYKKVIPTNLRRQVTGVKAVKNAIGITPFAVAEEMWRRH